MLVVRECRKMVPKLELHIHSQLVYFFISITISMGIGAVAPPVWANPKLNPCATQPRGWQLLFWPPDGKCYKIFQVGYPCPNGMELSPVTITTPNGEKGIAAECKCPPQMAQFARDGQCYELFTRGPCDKGQYFTLDVQYAANSQNKRQWGICKQTERCRNGNEIFWPQDGQCYLYLSKGPCPRGQLITIGPDKIGMCKCNYIYEMKKYWSHSNGCFEHFTRGPCKESGHLFLPDRSCGCHSFLPHYHNDTMMCYEINTIGPCNAGETFQLESNKQTASCQCKPGHIRYKNTLNCYRPYTQGPCEHGYILTNTTHCIKQPCERGFLYHPFDGTCYRIGIQGPCRKGHVITFDFESRPSIDGISYNGLCRCKQPNGCVEPDSDAARTTCSDESNIVTYSNRCYKLYSQGPCSAGAWLTVKKLNQTRTTITSESVTFTAKEGVCECMPGYKETTNARNTTECVAPTVILAEFLNKNYFMISVNKEI